MTSLHIKDRGDWLFRKSGFFAKDNNQEGAIPVILTLLLFLRVCRSKDFIYSPALNLSFDKLNCETDFCVLLHNHGDSPEIGIGECKSGFYGEVCGFPAPVP